MRVVQNVTEIQMAPGDRIVSAVAYHDMIVLVTERGRIFTVYPDDRGR